MENYNYTETSKNSNLVRKLDCSNLGKGNSILILVLVEILKLPKSEFVSNSDLKVNGFNPLSSIAAANNYKLNNANISVYDQEFYKLREARDKQIELDNFYESFQTSCRSLESSVKSLEKSKIEKLSLSEVSELSNLNSNFSKILKIVPSFKKVELVNLKLENSDEYLSDLIKVGIEVIV